MALFDGLSFGWRTALLTVAFVQLLLISLALLRPMANRVANRTLAMLLLVMAGIFSPWMIGFAGFYDKWQWLTFLPVQITLAVAPLVWLYAHALAHGRWPDRASWHLAPGIAQFAFLAASFALPLTTKEAWSERIGPAYDVVTSMGTMGGFALYSLASLRLLRRYRSWLADERSDDDRFAVLWLRRVLAAVLALAPLWAVYLVADWANPLGYRGLMGLYVAIAAFALFIGIEGWRHAALPFPAMPLQPDTAVEQAPARDWRAQGEIWVAKIRAEGWALNPEVKLHDLALRLGTNSSHLSRALNDGLGVNFSTFIAGLRCERVAAMIDAGRQDDLLDLALEAGFNSKASFNRAFRAATGMTPSAYRSAGR